MQSSRLGLYYSCKPLSQPSRFAAAARLTGFSTRFSETRRSNATTSGRSPPLAFVFDIDGVLLRGPNVLPEARRALNILDGNNAFRKKIPYILILPSQYVQAHTILKTLTHKYAGKSVLVLGGSLDKVREVAKGYGFEKAYTTLDVLAWNPSIWPFHTLTDTERNVAQPADFSQTPIEAIFVFHDPRNWALDVQVVCDVIQSEGIIGGPHIHVKDQRKPVELIFCNPDLIWRSNFDRPRLGQGAFKVAFQAVFKALTGTEYPHVQYGKPTKATYEFAEQILKGRIEELYGNVQDIPNVFHDADDSFLNADNPESDIAGANTAKWSSVLVNTGVFDPAQGPPTHPPTYHAENVEEAVKWAIEREMLLPRRLK
ncbi:HAD-like domain-containing protein [Crassisporium funariophilum]|nr:HAD-like domain-containing protein [Crassisporium funariophilum]